MPRGEHRSQPYCPRCQQHILDRRIDRCSRHFCEPHSGRHIVHQATNDHNGRFVEMLSQILDRAEHPLLLRLRLSWWWRTTTIPGNHYVECSLVDRLDFLLDFEILDHDETPMLHVAAGRRSQSRVDNLADHVVRYRVWLEPAHCAHLVNRFEEPYFRRHTVTPLDSRNLIWPGIQNSHRCRVIRKRKLS